MVSWTRSGRGAGHLCARSRSAASSAPRARSRRFAGSAGRRARARRPASRRSRTRRASASSSRDARARRARTGGRRAGLARRGGWYPSASDAVLRVQVPERAPARGVPRHERAGPSEVRGLRRLAARARALPGRRPLQGLGLLLDRLRPRRQEGGEGLRLCRTPAAARPAAATRAAAARRRRWLVRLVRRLRLVRLARAPAARRARAATEAGYCSGCPVRQPGPNVEVGGWGAESPAHIARTFRLSSDGRSTEEPPTVSASPPSRQ